jgi:hypothetical protein
VIARLVEEAAREAEIDELAHRVHAPAPADVDLRFAERRSTFVPSNDLFTGAATADQGTYASTVASFAFCGS